MFRKKVPILLFVIGIVLIFASVLWFFFAQQFGSASLTVDSVPEANVYIDGEMVGRTPYSGEFRAGEVTVKLLPLAFDSPRIPFEANVKLQVGVDTIVRRNLGETQLDSSGEIISFEKVSGNKASVTVVTTPDNAQVSLAGRSTEHAPIRFSDVEPSTYELTINAEGYESKTFSIVPKGGYTLTAIVNLAKLPEQATEEALPANTEEPQEQKKVIIQNTPVGFLRVRADASGQAPEVAQVKPDEEFVLLETSADGEWYKIELVDEDVDSGWISSQYAEVK